MKINIKLNDFEDKISLQKNLSTLLKKPLIALVNNKTESLPFCYEAEYFEDKSGFISIGICKELQKNFKTKRVKGQGRDETGKTIKIDKKKVAYGSISINSEGQFDFNVQGGMMKRMLAKSTIKSIPILKKIIGDNFLISVGEDIAEENLDQNSDNTESIVEKENNYDFKQNAKSIIESFKKNQLEFNSAEANKIPHAVKDWINRYKNAPVEVKQELQKVEQTLQKVFSTINTLLQIDKGLDKKISEIRKLNNQFNDILDHTTDESKKLAAKIMNDLESIKKDAVSLKDNALLNVIESYITELKN